VLIHADLHRGNIVINKDSIGVIDFDDCAYSYLLLDVATMLSSLYRISSPKHYRLVRHAYLSGYAAVRKPPDELEEVLPIFLVMRDLIIVNFIAGTHNAHVLSWGPRRLEGILLQLKNYLRSGAYAGDFSGHDEL
jgi:Ser/Thr protein kinase RdoA (MazF antagonist)